jgi:hypothetical protein
MRLRLLTAPVVGLLVVAVLIAGCGVTTLHSNGATHAIHQSAPAATPTPAILPALGWQTRTLPSGFVGWTISPANGRIAWACVPVQGSHSSFTILESRDEAATWATVGNLAPATPEPTASCELVPDEGSANTLVAVISWGSGEAGTLRSISLISTDSGAYWRRLAGDAQILQLATASGKTYAIIHNTDDTAAAQQPDGFVVSVDGLRS